MFGDLLYDAARVATGSLGLLAAASLGPHGQGMYEPCHGSAPDIAGQGLANLLAAILSGAMMLRYSLNMAQAAEGIEAAVGRVLDQGLRTTDIATEHSTKVSTQEMGDAVVKELLA